MNYNLESMILMDEWSFFNLGWLWFEAKQHYYIEAWNDRKYDEHYRTFKHGMIAGKDIAYELMIDNIMNWLLPQDDDAKSRYKWCVREFKKRARGTTKVFEEVLYEYFLRG